MHYRSLSDLGSALRTLSADIGRVDYVVGIPRSGMLAASVFALYENTPLFDLASYLAGRDIGHGFRALSSEVSGAPRVLVLDDSVASGRQMALARETISASELAAEHVFAAAFVTPESADAVDAYGEIVPTPRVFEWNLFHHGNTESWCSDIDGVFCPDPPQGPEDESDMAYLRHLTDAPCIRRPTGRVGTLVSNRLERHRGHTETWLRANGIDFATLVLRPEPTAAERRRVGGHAAYKAEVYRKTSAQLFIESDWGQSVTIANLTNRAVFCTDAWRMVYPGQTPAGPQHTRPGVITELVLSGRERLNASLSSALGQRNYSRIRKAVQRSRV